MAFDQYAADQIKPVRKMVSDELVEDSRVLSDAVALALLELYRNADEAGLRILGWSATFGRDAGSRFGEGLMTVTATDVARKSRRLSAAQMETEIMDLLSRPHSD